MDVPVPKVAGEILFPLSPEQCHPVSSEMESNEFSGALSSDQLDVVVERLIERLPETLRSLIPEVAIEVLDPPVADSN